jgi:hypothetical protein
MYTNMYNTHQYIYIYVYYVCILCVISPFSIGVGTDHFLPVAAVLTHIFHFFYFHCFIARIVISGVESMYCFLFPRVELLRMPILLYPGCSQCSMFFWTTALTVMYLTMDG